MVQNIRKPVSREVSVILELRMLCKMERLTKLTLGVGILRVIGTGEGLEGGVRTLSPEHLPQPGTVPKTVSQFESECDLSRIETSENSAPGLAFKSQPSIYLIFLKPKFHISVSKVPKYEYKM